MQYKVVCAALGALLVTAPAMSRQNPQSNTVAPKAEKTYCLQFALDTGSRINRTECRTKKEWAQRGVDVDSLGEK